MKHIEKGVEEGREEEAYGNVQLIIEILTIEIFVKHK